MTQNQEETPNIKPEQHVFHPGTDSFRYKVRKNQKHMPEIFEILHKWKPQSEVWMFKYGPFFLGVASSLSASYINWHFRETLYLLNYSRFSSYAVMFLAPGVSAGALHYIFVTSKILEEKKACSTCLQMRAMTFQTASSLLYPLILVPIICYPVAKRLQNYSVPNISYANKWPVIQFTREMLKPIRGPLWFITASQAILALAMTFYQQFQYTSVVKQGIDKVKTRYSPTHPRLDIESKSIDQTNESDC